MKKIALAATASAFFITAFLSLTVMLPSVAQAIDVDIPPDTATGTSQAISFQVPNPLGGDVTSINQVVANILDAFVILLAPVITIMLIYSGFLFVTAQGKAEELTKAKSALTYTLIGAAIVLGAKGISLVIESTINCLATSTTGC